MAEDHIPDEFDILDFVVEDIDSNGIENCHIREVKDISTVPASWRSSLAYGQRGKEKTVKDILESKYEGMKD